MTTAGTISDVTPTVNGVATATLTSGTFAETATVIAYVDGFSASVSVIIDPGPAARINVFADPASVEVGRTSYISATVVDVYGNPVKDGTSVQFTAT